MTTQGFVEIVKGSRGIYKKPYQHFKNFGQNVNFKSIASVIPPDAIEISCKNKNYADVFSEAIQSIKNSSTKTTALGCSIFLAALYLGYRLFNKSTESAKPVKNDTNNQ